MTRTRVLVAATAALLASPVASQAAGVRATVRAEDGRGQNAGKERRRGESGVHKVNGETLDYGARNKI